ncbi:MAG TPA: response regulator transcription factor [Rhodanobacteraceae bacterium]
MSNAAPIKVLVIHDDPLMRAGLIASLQSYSDIAPLSAEFDRIEAWLNGLPYGPVDAHVVVANYSNGIRLAEALSQPSALRVAPKILIVTASDTECDIRIAIERGVAGYLLAGCPLDQLAIGVRTLHRGGRHFSSGVMQRLAESMATEPLTGREEAVLQLVVDGLCNKAIAARLGVALGTVKTHLKAVFDKLGVQTRTQAVITVARRGLLRRRERAPAVTASSESLPVGTTRSFASAMARSSSHHEMGDATYRDRMESAPC